MKEIEVLMRKSSGLDPSALEQAVRLQMKHLGLAQVSDYRRLLDQLSAKQIDLLDSLNVQQSECSAQANYLLGLVREGGGDASALDCYRKALYLEPNHYERCCICASWRQRMGTIQVPAISGASLKGSTTRRN
jgi:hypothetical protein